MRDSVERHASESRARLWPVGSEGLRQLGHDFGPHHQLGYDGPQRPPLALIGHDED
jgi:hypothetical protein